MTHVKLTNRVEQSSSAGRLTTLFCFEYMYDVVQCLHTRSIPAIFVRLLHSLLVRVKFHQVKADQTSFEEFNVQFELCVMIKPEFFSFFQMFIVTFNETICSYFVHHLLITGSETTSIASL